ncbi:MAG: hypothetical protein NVS1B12_00960 [Acidimicrobiales bacterium]
MTLRRRVAVKVLHDALALDEGFLRRFRAEARVVASLRHPNIMAVYDWGEGNDGPYLVLEYLGGGSLRDLLDRGYRLSPSQAALAGLEVARGLDHAHRRGLIHRDIKPANLLFDDEGRLAIADFGIARALAEATWTEPAGAVVGTVRYASPEQARGNSLDGRADVYALALVLVEAITGKVPFGADTTIATLMGRLDRPIPTSAELGALAPVIEAAGAVDPADRVDAAGLVRALDAATHNLPRPAPLPLEPVEHLPLPEHEFDDHTRAFAPAVPSPAPSPPPVGPSVGQDLTVVGAVSLATGGETPAGASAMAAARPSATDDLPWAADGPPEERPRRRRGLVAGLILVLLAALAAGGFFAAVALQPTYPVPVLGGLPVAEVLTPHHYAHFTVTRHAVRERGAPVGVVLRQHPDAGTRHRAGPIVVDVSIGQPLVAVPDLSGLTQDQAQQRLAAVNLALGVVNQTFSDTVPAGRVASFDGAGSQLEEGSKVTITLSGGARFITMPDLTGQSADIAVAALAALGVTKEHVVQDPQFSDTAPVGTVIATDPGSGGRGDRGGTITLAVSKGPDTVRVPTVVGLTPDQARSTLVAAGLTVGAVYGPPGPSLVIAVRPGSGTVVKRGSSVSLFVV